ncbi:MAG: hypothetical protein HGB35_05860 [Geobacteraceae bacterium]|nr:hypothetical protein [Geobacteraceae bacterium]
MKNCIFKYRYELFLSTLVLVMLAIMEARYPYFFLQDDNRTYHLPYYVHNLRALLGGELPLFNFNQYLGTPVSFLSAPFYPVNYIALLLSRLFLGHYYGVMECIAAFHLTVAVVGFYRFSRSFGLEGLSCCFGAIAWAFSPFVITVGNSWIHTLGYAAYLPWILSLSIRQIDGFNGKNCLLLLFFRLLTILLGFPQSVLYMATFDLLLVTMLYCARDKKCSRQELTLSYCGNYLLLLVVSLPFLLQLFREAALSFNRKSVLSWEEYILYHYRIVDWLNGLLAPFHDNGNHLFGELNFVSHIGYLTIFFAGASFCIFRQSSFRREILVFALLALFSFLWSADIVVTKAFYHLPLFNKLRYPFKLQFFTGFFLVTLAAFGFNYFAIWLRDKCRGGAFMLLCTLLLLHTLNFLALYTVLPQRMLSNHLDRPPFAEPLKERLSDGRIVSAGPDVVWDGERVVPGNTVPTLGYNFAMLWNLQQFGGYEALLSERNFTAAMGVVNNSIFNVAPDTALDFAADVPLDWVMIANSLTIKNHPPELLRFVTQLHSKGVLIINSAVFHSGHRAGSVSGSIVRVGSHRYGL